MTNVGQTNQKEKSSAAEVDFSIGSIQCAKKKFGCTCPSDSVKEILTCPNHNIACPKNFTFPVHVCIMNLNFQNIYL